MAQRVPQVPSVVDMTAGDKQPGKPGGEIAWMIGRARDLRVMNTYSYARLVGYGTDFKLHPDILQSVDVEGEKVFTLHLRPGHKWSDGQPFTSDDFRFPPGRMSNRTTRAVANARPGYQRLLVDGEAPKVEYPDALTVRYSWSKPNPEFLPWLAGAAPLYIYAPAHYLKQFHKNIRRLPRPWTGWSTRPEMRNWVALYNLRSKLIDSANPQLPVLEPWVVTTKPPAERFVFVRNPYYHRIDSQGRQLPYIDRVVVNVVEGSLIPAKAGTGEADLQARGLRFDNISFLKAGQEAGQYKVRLWPTALGSEVALYPNMNCTDKDWRTLNRDVRFRRALSLGIDRDEINQTVFFGQARPSQNTVLPESPYYDAAVATEWTEFDIDKANALLDEAGLGNRDSDGIRLMPNGRRLEIVVESTGERTIEVRHPAADPGQLGQDRRRPVHHPVAARCSCSGLFRRDRDVGLDRHRQRPDHADHPAVRAGADRPELAAISEMGPVPADQGHRRREGGRALRLAADGPVRRVAQHHRRRPA